MMKFECLFICISFFILSLSSFCSTTFIHVHQKPPFDPHNCSCLTHTGQGSFYSSSNVNASIGFSGGSNQQGSSGSPSSQNNQQSSSKNNQQDSTSGNVNATIGFSGGSNQQGSSGSPSSQNNQQSSSKNNQQGSSSGNVNTTIGFSDGSNQQGSSGSPSSQNNQQSSSKNNQQGSTSSNVNTTIGFSGGSNQQGSSGSPSSQNNQQSSSKNNQQGSTSSNVNTTIGFSGGSNQQGSSGSPSSQNNQQSSSKNNQQGSSSGNVNTTISFSDGSNQQGSSGSPSSQNNQQSSSKNNRQGSSGSTSRNVNTTTSFSGGSNQQGSSSSNVNATTGFSGGSNQSQNNQQGSTSKDNKQKSTSSQQTSTQTGQNTTTSGSGQQNTSTAQTNNQTNAYGQQNQNNANQGNSSTSSSTSASTSTTTNSTASGQGNIQTSTGIQGESAFSSNISFQGSFKKVYAFGDSFTDTGNAVAMEGLKSFVSGLFKNHFYGSSTQMPGHRLSNGRLVIDFLCDSLGLPPIQAYKEGSANLNSGANFAVAGSTCLTSDFFSNNKIPHTFMWKSKPENVLAQVDWFNKFLLSVGCKGQGEAECKSQLQDSLFWVGAIGFSDYARIFGAAISGRSLTEVSVDHSYKILKAMLDRGAKYIVVQGLPPAGCCPLQLLLNPSKDRDSMGCASSINSMIEAHNNLLQKKLGELRAQYNGSVIIYADTWNAYKTVLVNSKSFNFQEPFKACCGAGGGRLNFDLHSLCGSTGTSACNNPQNFISWDGIHFTEAMHKVLTNMFLHQGFCTPSFDALIKAKMAKK